MFASSPHRIHGLGRKTAFVLLGSLLSALAFSAPVGAAGGSSVKLTPAAVLRAHLHPQHRIN